MLRGVTLSNSTRKTRSWLTVGQESGHASFRGGTALGASYKTLLANDSGKTRGQEREAPYSGRPRGSPLLWTGLGRCFIRSIVGATLVVAHCRAAIASLSHSPAKSYKRQIRRNESSEEGVVNRLWHLIK